MPEAGGVLAKVAIALIVIVVLATAASGWYQIDSTERGVMRNWGVLDVYNIQTQKYTLKVDSASKDLQQVETEVTVNYHLDPAHVQNIAQMLGHNWEDLVLMPAMKEVTKNVTAQFEAGELITRRGEVKSRIEMALQSRMTPYYLVLDPSGVSLTDFQYSKEFADAIEQKVVAVQLMQKAENDLARINIEAQQKIESVFSATLKYENTLLECYADNRWSFDIYNIGNPVEIICH